MRIAIRATIRLPAVCRGVSCYGPREQLKVVAKQRGRRAERGACALARPAETLDPKP